MLTGCPTSPIKLKLYGTARSKWAGLRATDNAGRYTTTVSPNWFRLDVPVVAAQKVTYTVRDYAMNTATCTVNIEVKGESFRALCLCLSLNVCVCVYDRGGGERERELDEKAAIT